MLGRKGSEESRMETICKTFALVHREILPLKSPYEAGCARQQPKVMQGLLEQRHTSVTFTI
jgi:hypothetical protein